MVLSTCWKKRDTFARADSNVSFELHNESSMICASRCWQHRMDEYYRVVRFGNCIDALFLKELQLLSRDQIPSERAPVLDSSQSSGDHFTPTFPWNKRNRFIYENVFAVHWERWLRYIIIRLHLHCMRLRNKPDDVTRSR